MIPATERPVVAVCLNAAVDVTYDLAGSDTLVPGRSYRAVTVTERAGGKGVNVARVLHQLGAPVVVRGFAGGVNGEVIRAQLAAAGVREALTATVEVSRRCVTIVDRHDATVINEPGPIVSAAEWAALLDAPWHGAAAVALSGSLPRGLPVDAYASLVRSARAAGARTVVDAEGDVLRAALESRPDVVTPNAAEAALALGRPVRTVADAVAAGHELLATGAACAVISRGTDGLVLVDADGAVLAQPGQLIGGNPTGAGDALTAVFAGGLAGGVPPRVLLADAVATAAAAVAMPFAGAIDPAVRDRVAATTTVREL